jgi:hypothetical protein
LRIADVVVRSISFDELRHILRRVRRSPVWKDVKYWCLELSTRTSNLKGKVGKEDTSDPLSKVEEGFLKLGDSLKAAYDKFNEFGKNWQAICETCR